MKLKKFLYLTQLEEYDIKRIQNWLKNNPGREVAEVKKHLVWTTKIKLLYCISSLLFFLPPQISVLLGLKLLAPLDWFLKTILVTLAKLKLVLFHRHLRVITITGSWGKTTVKETLFASISKKYKTSSTIANQNTLIGISLRLLRLPLDTEIFICEAGAYYPGDIKQICRLVRPRIGIITAIGSMHLERFGTLENIQKTKMELAESLPPNGHLYLPDDQRSSMNKFILKTSNILFFKKIDEVYQSIARLLDIESIAPLASSDHRLQVIKNGSINIIDDTYNSNPLGFEMALKLLDSQKVDQKILITPGMIELGHLQFSENARLAKIAGKICDYIIIVGQTNKDALLSGLKNTKAKVYTIQKLSETDQLLPSIYKGTAAVLFENDLSDQYL